MEDLLFFPHPSLADKSGLLAIGGDLNPHRLLLAYQFGIFPWYNQDEPILWWSPDPRCVLYPEELKVTKSMRNFMRKNTFRITLDQEFVKVIQACRLINRTGQSGTWITCDMEHAYIKLHKLGYAHSVEVWQNDQLVGGLYGIGLGKIFFGESMFSNLPNASKFGFIKFVQILKEMGFFLIDCQQDTSHLRSLGATTIPRESFLNALRKNIFLPSKIGSWQGISKKL